MGPSSASVPKNVAMLNQKNTQLNFTDLVALWRWWNKGRKYTDGRNTLLTLSTADVLRHIPSRTS
jgi:uncharacterized protein YjiS (DUF1127 family)